MKSNAIAALISDGKLIIGDGYRAKNEELSADGLPFARAQNINDGFKFEGADRLPIKHLAKVGNKVSQPGDVVFTSKGTVGRFALVQPDTPRFVYSPQLCFWRSLDSETIDPRWLFYWMQGREFYEQYKGVAGQTDMADYVSLRDQRAMSISLPRVEEQRPAAEVLSALDDKIAINRRLSETLEAIAQALFQSWFVDFDPVRAKASGEAPESICQRLGLTPDLLALFPDRLVESELGEIPEGWEARPLDQIANYLNGLALQKFPPTSDEEWLPVIKIAQLKSGSIIGTDRASHELKPEYIVDDGDVLFSWSGSLEVDLWCSGRGALNQHLFKVTSDQYPKWFYFFCTKHHLTSFRAIAAGKAVTMGHIQRKHLTEALCAVPSKALFEAATEIIGPMLLEHIETRKQSRRLSAIRDALLPKLLSGEIQIPEEESP